MKSGANTTAIGKSFTKRSFLRDSIKRTDRLTSTLLSKYTSGEFPYVLSGYALE